MDATKKHNMDWLRGKSDSELQKLYDEYNLIISRVRGMAKAGLLVSNLDPTGRTKVQGYSLKDYNEAVKNRARILTIFNQKRFKRNHRSGVINVQKTN